MDPVFGDMQYAPTLVAVKESGRAKSMHCSKFAESSSQPLFHLLREELHQPTGHDGHEAGHTLEPCIVLEKKAHDEKTACLKTNGVCFGCLCTRHVSRVCRKRLTFFAMYAAHDTPACCTSIKSKMKRRRKRARASP